MSKFAIECPNCGCINEKKWYQSSVMDCAQCKTQLDFKKLRMIARVCPKCGNTFIYDQKKKHDKCPVCKHSLDFEESLASMTEQQRDIKKKVRILCPQCSCEVYVLKDAVTDKCPVCECEINVKLEQERANLVNDTGISEIKYEGDNSTFVWKHPIEDFNLGSQLIVHESQEAVFFLNGEALDSFGPGRHTLETENLPILKKIYSMPAGGQKPFHAEVYFVNKTVQMGMRWGTADKIHFIDPVSGIPLELGASGELSMQVCEPRKLLIKLVGTTRGLSGQDVLAAADAHQASVTNTTVQSFFRAPLMNEVKAYLGTAIKEQHINILEIDSHLGELSQALRKRIAVRFEEFGLTIPQFDIIAVSLPENDPNFKRIKELISSAYLKVREEEVAASIAAAAQKRKVIEAQNKVIEAQGTAESNRVTGLADAEVMRAKGYTHKDEIEAEVQKAYAQGIGNMGGGSSGGGTAGGGMVSDMVGMVAGLKAAETMVGRMDGLFGGIGKSEASPVQTWTCSCGETGNTKAFCMSCGKAKPTPQGDVTWTCPACGETGNTKKFCMNCGKAKPSEAGTWTCPACGEAGNTKNFCMNCGAKKPESEEDGGWTCPACGEAGNTKNFCMNCGAKKPE